MALVLETGSRGPGSRGAEMSGGSWETLGWRSMEGRG